MNKQPNQRVRTFLNIAKFIGDYDPRFEVMPVRCGDGVTAYVNGDDRIMFSVVNRQKIDASYGCSLREDDERGKFLVVGEADTSSTFPHPAANLAYLVNETAKFNQVSKETVRIKEIIAIRGKAFSGKTTVKDAVMAARSCSTMRIQYLPMATKLKHIAYQIGWNGLKDSAGRSLLQNIGDTGRSYNPYSWVNYICEESFYVCQYDAIIVDDLRYPEEAIMLQAVAKLHGAKFTVLHVKAPAAVRAKRRERIGAVDPGNHSSEDTGILDRFLRAPFFSKAKQAVINNPSASWAKDYDYIREQLNKLGGGLRWLKK